MCRMGINAAVTLRGSLIGTRVHALENLHSWSIAMTGNGMQIELLTKLHGVCILYSMM